MRFNKTFALGMALITATVAVMLIMTLAFPAMAAPNGQGGMLATPTVYPLAELDYEFQVVGGVDKTLTFEHPDQDGFVIGTTTAHSIYPDGMVWTVQPESPNGNVTDVTFYATFGDGSRYRSEAFWDDEQEAWVARPWALGDGGSMNVAWLQFEFSWRVRDQTGAYVDTAPIAAEYWDPTRTWYRLDMTAYTVFWYGFMDDDPETFARLLVEGVEATEPRRQAGFGGALGFKQLGIVYPTADAYAETLASGVYEAEGQAGITMGFTYPGVPVTVQFLHVGHPGFPPQRIIDLLPSTLAHELTHTYQGKFNIGGPTWWTEGTAEWFSPAPGTYDINLFELARMQYDLPSLTGEIGYRLPVPGYRGVLAYDVGASFVNWFVATYGFETLAEVLAVQAASTPVRDAIAQVTGQTFVEVENAWRAYIGFAPVDPCKIDPAACLEVYEDPMLAVGDQVTLPAMPPLVKMYMEPGEGKLPGPQCFGNTVVTITQMGAVDGIAYFEIDCMGLVGWVTREVLVGP